MSSRFPELCQITSYDVTDDVLLWALPSCFYLVWVINGPRSMSPVQPNLALMEHNLW